jgi:hypothetical protein
MDSEREGAEMIFSRGSQPNLNSKKSRRGDLRKNDFLHQLTTESRQTRASYRKHSRENGNAIPGAIGPLFKPDGASFPAKR